MRFCAVAMMLLVACGDEAATTNDGGGVVDGGEVSSCDPPGLLGVPKPSDDVRVKPGTPCADYGVR